MMKTEERARFTKGESRDAIYRMLVRALEERRIQSTTLLDIGCGSGRLSGFAANRIERYIGIDVIRFEGFPEQGEFHLANLDSERIPLEDGAADVVAAIEVIEHLENPRAFARELVRLVKPGGWIFVTTPNQLSALSLLTLLFRKRFSSFQDCDYPAHITALLEVDLHRISLECGLSDLAILYSHEGRIPFTPYYYPKFLSRIWPRLLSDNILLACQKPGN